MSRVAQQLGDADRNSGFFYITGHGVPQELIDSVLEASKQFHAKSASLGTLDFSSPAGGTFQRQGQIRYTASNGFAISIENPETDGNRAAGRLEESLNGANAGEDLIPDLILAWRGGPGGRLLFVV